MLPQDGTYGGTPTPRNDSAASVRTAAANTNEACTMTGDRQFGSTWRATMTTSEVPSARAASTYVVSRITSTEPRTIRATRGAYTTPMATMTLRTLGPSDATGASVPTASVTANSTMPTTVARRRTSRTSQSARRRGSGAGRERTRTLIEARVAY